MGKFKLRLKETAAVGLLIICIGMVFYFALGEDEKTVENKSMKQHAGEIVQDVLTGEPVMPKGYRPDAAWRDPFAAPKEIVKGREK